MEADRAPDNLTGERPPLTLDEALENLKQTQDLGLRYYAAWWLGRCRVREPIAIELLLAALEDESDRTPDGGYPLRRNAATALGKLGDRASVPAVIRCLDCEDYYVREAAAQALAMLGDPVAISPLLRFLDGGVEAAVGTPGKPHLIQPYEAIIEALGALGASEAIGAIEPFMAHSVPKVQYASARAMYQLTQNAQYGEYLVKALQNDNLQLRRSALMDLGAIGYLPAAEAIAETLAENSMKLISLKGVLERAIANNANQSLLSPESERIMTLMDDLL